VLPILHLNGYKIANPTVLARIPREELVELLKGYGYDPHFVEGHEPMPMHQLMAETLDQNHRPRFSGIQKKAREHGVTERPRWPMIVLMSPKGWTGPGLWTASRWKGHGERTRCRCRKSAPIPSI
jgi:xylulose-5-phosphate/fructose-6-phosphate phosphoketolase